MTTPITRAGKGSALTWDEMDSNFTDLNTEADAAATAAAAAQTTVDNHIADTADAHDASAISNVAAGGIVATTVQAAIDELDTEKAPKADPTFTGVVTAPTVNLTGGQIAFPATQAASSDANTLDDYEENTWTPTLLFGGAAVGMTYSSQTGRYTKIGRMVVLSGRIVLSAKGSSTGVATITGLPFNCDANTWVTGMVDPATAVTITNGMLLILSGGTLNVCDTATRGLYTDTAFANTSDFRFSITYFV